MGRGRPDERHDRHSRRAPRPGNGRQEDKGVFRERPEEARDRLAAHRRKASGDFKNRVRQPSEQKKYVLSACTARIGVFLATSIPHTTSTSKATSFRSRALSETGSSRGPRVRRT